MYENLAFHRVQISIPGHHQSGNRRKFRQQMLMHRAAQDSVQAHTAGNHVSTRVVRGRRVADKKKSANNG